MTAAALSPSRSGLGRGADRRPAYGDAAHAALTPRQAEYRIFARVTHRLSEAQAALEAGEIGAYSRLASAAHDNLRLWLTLAADLMIEENGLPETLRAGLLSLAAYVERETPRLVKREISAAPLVEINASVMKGLRGQVEAP
ncbi:flagellar biosynthesis regulator FlaF [Albimonas sp. CAU 1670]|uniref:flagellar biosynthesis regulator FlaF n=1 Tax=Albimonas sp. CAU 1670 TaxID=3032599 RepID=UPI0023DAC82C|nr:flagellar biosynthesis regulator FlaF [Albimonas sp. CAU 1670]MDF2235597.1 flagellar biosynthesis regulator FlaF [Albimonas sp. CAU 1670]